MSTREIETYIADLYGPGVGRDTVSRVTAVVLEDAKAWQTRPLETVYPILYLDALVIKIRDGQAIRNFSCYLAIGVNTDGERDVLGMWFQRTEGAKFWLQVLTELRQRGVQDVLVCCVDGLTGFPDAIEAVFPQAWVQTCIVHQIRSSLRFVPYKDKKKVAADLRKIYTAVDRDHAEAELESFAEAWDAKYPMISQSWIEHWERIVPFLAFPTRCPPGRLHHEHDRGAQPPNPKDHQDPRQLPERGLSPQAALPRDHQRPKELAAHLPLERRARRLPNPLRRPATRQHNLTITNKITNNAYTENLTPSLRELVAAAVEPLRAAGPAARHRDPRERRHRPLQHRPHRAGTHDRRTREAAAARADAPLGTATRTSNQDPLSAHQRPPGDPALQRHLRRRARRRWPSRTGDRRRLVRVEATRGPKAQTAALSLHRR